MGLLENELARRLAPPDNIGRPSSVSCATKPSTQLDVAAAIVDLAVRGYLRIRRWREEAPDYRLVVPAGRQVAPTRTPPSLFMGQVTSCCRVRRPSRPSSKR